MPRNVKLHGLIDGRMLKAMDDGETYGFVPAVIRIDTASGADNTVGVTMVRPFTVIDVHAKNIGGAGASSDTLQIKKGSTAISDALDMSGADNAVVRAGVIDDAAHELAAGDVLNAVALDSSGDNQPAKIVYVMGYYHV